MWLLLYTSCVHEAPYVFNDILIIFKKKEEEEEEEEE
jgi:hypothetical protein